MAKDDYYVIVFTKMIHQNQCIVQQERELWKRIAF